MSLWILLFWVSSVLRSLPAITVYTGNLANNVAIALAPCVQTLDSTIQWISIRESNYVMHWIEIYLVDNIIHLLNNWALFMIYFSGGGNRKESSCHYSSGTFWAENFGEVSSTQVSYFVWR